MQERTPTPESLSQSCCHSATVSLAKPEAKSPTVFRRHASLFFVGGIRPEMQNCYVRPARVAATPCFNLDLTAALRHRTQALPQER